MSEKLNGSGGTTQWTDYLFAGGEMIGMRVEHSSSGIYTRYFHKDHLGSISTITDEAGAVVEQLSYDAWGKRRNLDGTDDPAGSLASQTTRGFTGHEQLTEVGLVHMNGRVYDPLIGRFGAPDPMTESPYSTQGWNRYSYVGNSPLNFADPSGYCFLGCFWQKPFKALGKLLRETPIIGNILTVAAGVICGPVCSTLASAAVAGLASGDLGQALKAGLISAVTAAAMFGVGEITSHGTLEFLTKDHVLNMAGHAAVGCGSAVLSGGECGPGALSGAVGSFTSNLPFAQNLGDHGQLIFVSISGGVASHLGGGKFGNGALTAAFGYLFNQAVRGFREDLREHEALGGHTIKEHVGKGPEYLLRRASETSGGWGATIVRRRAGSFPSLEAANRLVNSTLSQNTQIVDRVISGEIPYTFITGTFASKTGIEAYRPSPSAQPYLRETYGVGIRLDHAPNAPSGFHIITAYPRND